MKKILILGANSFAGTSFVKYLLSKNFYVFSTSRSAKKKDPFNIYKEHVTNKNYQFKKIDINKKKDLEKIKKIILNNKIQIIVDFGSQSMVGQSWDAPEDWVRTNCLGKLNLVRKLSKIKKIKYIRISTPEVYGDNTKKIRENDNILPSTPYAITQATADFFTFAYTKFRGLNSITLRFANFYGSGQQLYRIVPRTILAALGKGKLTLDGGGTSIRSFIHRRDVASGILATLRHGSLGETYHFSNDEFVSIKELVVKISNLMDVDMEDFCVDGPERMGKDQAYLMNAEKVFAELGWSSAISLSCGLIETVDWLKANIDELEKHPFEYAHQI